MRTSVLRALLFGAIAGVLFTLWKAWGMRARDAAPGTEWENAPFPFPPVPRPAPPNAVNVTRPLRAHTTTTTRKHVHVPPEVQPGGGPETERDGEVAIGSIAAWVPPIDGACPTSHPVKAKLASGIFHVPGGMNYERTNADRCYLDATAAEQDGLRPSKM
jgi:hypothetical protein